MLVVEDLLAAGVPRQVFAGMTRQVWQVSARAKLHERPHCPLVGARRARRPHWLSCTVEVADVNDGRVCTCLRYASDEPALAALGQLVQAGTQLAQAAAALLADPFGQHALTHLGALTQSNLPRHRSQLNAAVEQSGQALTFEQESALTGWLDGVTAQCEAALTASDCRDLDMTAAAAASDLRPCLKQVADRAVTDQDRLALLGTRTDRVDVLERADEAFVQALRDGQGSAAAVRAAAAVGPDDTPTHWKQLPDVTVPAGGSLPQVALAAWRAERATLLAELATASARTYDWLATQRELVLALSALDETDPAQRAAGLLRDYPVLAERDDWQARTMPHVLAAAAQATGLLMVVLPMPDCGPATPADGAGLGCGPVRTYVDAALALVDQVDEDVLAAAAAGVASVRVPELAVLAAGPPGRASLPG